MRDTRDRETAQQEQVETAAMHIFYNRNREKQLKL